MFKKCFVLLSLILCLSITGCDHFRNQYIKYYKIFPTETQYKKCFGDEYYCEEKDITEENFNTWYGAYKYVGVYYWNNNDEQFNEDILNISLEMADSQNDLSEMASTWVGEFDKDYQLESNNRFSLYYLSDDLEYNGYEFSLYGKLYYDNFEVYFYSINYSKSYQLVLDHLDESIDYLNKLYDLVDSNRIEAGL